MNNLPPYKIRITKKQWELLEAFNNDSITEILFWWWWRWWKTWGIAEIINMTCIAYPWIVWWICRNEWEDLRKSSLITITKVLNNHWIKKDEHYSLNMQTKELTFINWSKIFFIPIKQQPSDQEFNFLWWYELTYVFVDEAQETSRKAIDVLKTRCTEKIVEYWLFPKVILACNPMKWHLYNDFIKPMKEWTIKQDRIFIQSLYKDNPFLDHRKYEDQYKNSDKVTKERLLKWNWEYDDTPWRLFDYDKILDLFKPKSPFTTKRYISCDVARQGKDKCVIFVWEWFNVIDYTIFDKSTIPEVIKEIRYYQEKYWVDNQRTIVDEDWVGWWVVDWLWCIGFVNNSTPVSPYWAKQQTYLKRNYANLKTQCYFELARIVNDNIMSIDCEIDVKNSIIEELDIIVQVNLDDDQKIKIISKEEMKEKLWRSSDFWDCLMMRCYFNLVFEWVEEEPEHPKYKDKEFDLWNWRKTTWKELMWEDISEDNEDSLF